MKILITGGAGFIGSNLAQALSGKGYDIIVLDLVAPTFKEAIFFPIDLVKQRPSQEMVQGVDVLFHLVGRPIGVRWSQKVKEEIWESRVGSARNLIEALRELPPRERPRVFVSASGVGYYGDRGEEELDEVSPPGDDFLARVCGDWEEAAQRAEELGIRVVSIRTAPVLGEGGLLKELFPLYRLGLGGPLCKGYQWFPWIHMDDLVAIYLFAFEHAEIQGPVNAVSPGIVRQKEFARELGNVLSRPALLSFPKWVLKFKFGELADFLCVSLKVRPRKLLKVGFRFRFPKLKEAIREALLTF